ncbi:PREDICTED: beta-1,3-galactosyltransferase 5-like isoform X2 [Priapulus caudatus]|uniref:Hexosyltransferase n=1 Tax=Priapulus caudatus TaxID=37621 RepID=A0ABM1EVI9_PRICU|nr:PREDICTED: beta-1,3-galactosyltransferase 5-like isoform X2 [Priapulus caudatus]
MFACDRVSLIIGGYPCMNVQEMTTVERQRSGTMACSTIQCQLVILSCLIVICILFIVCIMLCPLCIKLPELVSADWHWNPPFDLKQTAPANRLINLTNFSFVIDSDVCGGGNGSEGGGGDVFLLILVHSAPGNAAERTAIRQTWGYATDNYGVRVRTAFLLADPRSERMQRELVGEAARHGDIVQGNFVDSYRNLTYKLMMGMKWAAARCARAQFVLKSDDDVFVDTFAIVRMLRETYAGRGDLLLCNVWTGMPPVRDAASKWYLSPDEFADAEFKPYCSGWAIVLGRDVARAFSLASTNMTYLWIDDVTTGILASELSLRFTKLNEHFALNSHDIGKWAGERALTPPPFVITTYNRNTVFLQNIWRKCEEYYLNKTRPRINLFKWKLW